MGFVDFGCVKRFRLAWRRLVAARMYDPRGDWRHITRQLDVPPDFVFTTRIDLGMNSVLAGLRATGHWRAVLDELDAVAPPVTELGREQASWAARRGVRVES